VVNDEKLTDPANGWLTSIATDRADCFSYGWVRFGSAIGWNYLCTLIYCTSLNFRGKA
jgi:hypothetical protein